MPESIDTAIISRRAPLQLLGRSLRRDCAASIATAAQARAVFMGPGDLRTQYRQAVFEAISSFEGRLA